MVPQSWVHFSIFLPQVAKLNTGYTAGWKKEGGEICAMGIHGPESKDGLVSIKHRITS